jgi:hypothetical protein
MFVIFHHKDTKAQRINIKLFTFDKKIMHPVYHAASSLTNPVCFFLV